MGIFQILKGHFHTVEHLHNIEYGPSKRRSHTATRPFKHDIKSKNRALAVRRSDKELAHSEGTRACCIAKFFFLFFFIDHFLYHVLTTPYYPSSFTEMTRTQRPETVFGVALKICW